MSLWRLQAEKPKEEDVAVKAEEVPVQLKLLVRGKRFAQERWRSASISLDGLLDYDEEVITINNRCKVTCWAFC